MIWLSHPIQDLLDAKSHEKQYRVTNRASLGAMRGGTLQWADGMDRRSADRPVSLKRSKGLREAQSIAFPLYWVIKDRTPQKDDRAVEMRVARQNSTFDLDWMRTRRRQVAGLLSR